MTAYLLAGLLNDYRRATFEGADPVKFPGQAEEEKHDKAKNTAAAKAFRERQRAKQLE